MEGERYSLGNKRITQLLPFIEAETQAKVDLFEEAFSQVYHSIDLPSQLEEDGFKLLQSATKLVSRSVEDRIRHGMGHCQEDVFLVRSGCIPRVPDLVVWPETEEIVQKIVRLAQEHSFCLMPYGGGTNVSQATRCPSIEVEPRPIISVDMKRMNKIIWIDEENRLARVEAGITGRDLVEEIGSRGYIIGHEPDSIEFSTLGGWVATKASGMKRNKYGNIEDVVKAVSVVTPGGILQHGDADSRTRGRESTGLNLRDLVLGSEGCLGIITSVVLRIWPKPEVHDYDGLLLADFDAGVRFARDVSRMGASMPVSVRLLDNEHFRLGQALRPESESHLAQAVNALVHVLGKIALSFNSRDVVCVTITYEGTKDEVASQKKAIARICSDHGGVRVGRQAGKTGYDLTFMIAYLRDFAMSYHFLGESFETFVPWSKIASVVHSTKRRIKKEHASRYLPGKPFIGCRVTQLYHEGVCLYFYFCMNFENVNNASHIFAEIEEAAREEILAQGGSLSHHHGVGKLRARFLKDIQSPALRSTIQSIKLAMDPDNVFGGRNGPFAEL